MSGSIAMVQSPILYMSEYLSNKIRVLSALLILMVLYIHMYYTEGSGNLFILENIVGGGFCSVAVPLFYLISGYLFFLKVPDGLFSIVQKMKKRCRTLLIPYLVANILTFLFYALLNVITWKMPAIDKVVNFKVLDVLMEKGLWATLELVFIAPPIAFQLWFVKYLMVVILFSPLIYFALKYAVTKTVYIRLAVAILLVVFIYGHTMLARTVFWFVAGGLFAMARTGIENKRYGKFTTAFITALYVFLSVGAATGILAPEWKRYIPLVGVPAIWLLYDLVADYNRKAVEGELVLFFSKYTFFVYLCHEPLLNIFKKTPLLISRSETMFIASYLIIPILFYLAACLLGYCCRSIAPRLYSIYTGGR